MHEVRDNVNAMQGGFTTFHEDIALLRDRVRHNHSIAPSDRERHDWSGYNSWYHDDGLDRGSRRERIPKFHGESHSRGMRDHGHHKVHEWLMGEETSSKARKSSNSQHYGCGTSGRSVPPKKVDLSHPSYHTKVSSWLSSNFPPSKSLIQSERDNVNRIVKERVKYRVDFIANENEEQCDDEKESMSIYEEDAHPTFNDGVPSIVEAEDECEPLNALQILNTEPKLHEVANGNKHLREDREKEKKLESEGMLQKPIECEKRQKCETQKPRESGGGECESKLSREKNYKHVRKKSGLLDYKVNLGE
ncbi:uncharacterized protein LOC121770702 isoform X2 [Salvia splendens]|uniref:uncharacterized protein LOC121770702 isoform X2 n=1 Tax=Salvia splendens TaxID=180675 RepID=UPI001C279BE1|nr:uncharacterized protein LOC121770702 isoform X2 [Salvia splendens]